MFDNPLFQETVMFVGTAMFAAFLVWLLYRRHELTVKTKMQQLEYRNKLLEKFANASEFVEFAQSEKGKSLLESEASRISNPAVGVIRTIQVGVASLFIGIALMIASTRLNGLTDINFVRQALDERFWGTVGISFGIGLILAGLIAYILAKNMGLISMKFRIGGRET